MSAELAHPGHVRYVQKWLSHNGDRIAAAVVPPEQVNQQWTGSDFVRWLSSIVEQHHRLCEQEHSRRPPFTAYTGD